jgi:hypothetical protein
MLQCLKEVDGVIMVRATDKMQLCSLIYFSSQLYVFRVIIAHHQEHLTVFTVSGSIHPNFCQLVSSMS